VSKKFWDDVKFLTPVKAIVKEYNKRRGGDEPLDGDEVDALIERIRNTMNLDQGNITPTEYFDMEHYFGDVAKQTAGADAFVRNIRQRKAGIKGGYGSHEWHQDEIYAQHHMDTDLFGSVIGSKMKNKNWMVRVAWNFFNGKPIPPKQIKREWLYADSTSLLSPEEFRKFIRRSQ
jgi:hypothetical protein